MIRIRNVIKNIEKRLGRLISTIEQHNSPGCEVACPRIFEPPVCGTDGKTYAGTCALDSAACKTQNPDLTIASKGKCAGITLHYQDIDLRFITFFFIDCYHYNYIKH